MRLPEKKEVDRLKLLEQQEEAKIGLKLARQVDDVRIELIKEQNNLEKFRTETTKLVQKEIDSLFQTKESLKYENDVLERHNKNLKAPFDEEWESIRNIRIGELDARYDEVEHIKTSIERERAEIARIRLQNEADRVAIELQLKQASEAREQAKNELKSADSILENARIQQAEVQSRIDAENNQLDKKAQELALTLRDIEVREAAMQKSARELARRERFIKSKYKVLMQTQQALQK
jgi:hypothetical protein